MRFLFVADDFHPVRHAPAVRIRSFINALADHEVTLVAGCSSPLPPGMYPWRLVRVERPPERQPIRFLIFLLRLGRRATEAARHTQPDCIVVSVPKFELLLPAMALRRHAPRLVLDFRDSVGFVEYDSYLRHFLPWILARPLGAAIKGLVRRIVTAACRRADLVTAANAAIAASLPAERSRVLTVENGVDTELFRPRTRGPIPPISIVYLGNYSEKDRFELLTAAARAAGARIVLHLIGTGRNKPSVLKQLHAAGVPTIDHGAVPHDALPEVLAPMHLGLLFRSPGATDSIPVSLYEFCALNIPVVVNDVGAMAAFVRRHRLGWVVTDAAQLVDLLRTAASDPVVLGGDFAHLRSVAEREFSRARRSREMRVALVSLVASSDANQLQAAMLG